MATLTGLELYTYRIGFGDCEGQILPAVPQPG